ncbi:hypothetical protein SAMN05443144_11767 [Fodinibius roseus]|uniref:Uncharacterized protein n=1 Tax=Fodinibius roseus TaxID=1194090 RepID=A0A1M5GIN4_9BACT|nr:hypothetical protein SAMN05443144_11767 [Fodinibius roseus]
MRSLQNRCFAQSLHFRDFNIPMYRLYTAVLKSLRVGIEQNFWFFKGLLISAF